MNIEKTTKSRNLQLSDFYSILQQEYICYMIRTKIYPAPYSDKYIEYCKFKKEKIDTISLRNCLPSIFKNEDTYNKYLNKIINQWGLPNFEYRDEKSKDIMGFWDKVYWFHAGTKVQIKVEDTYYTGEVVKNLTLDDKVFVKTEDGKLLTSYYICTSRLNEEQFLKIK